MRIGAFDERGWKSSTEKLEWYSWVFVGRGAGPPVGGSVIGAGLAPARHAATTAICLPHSLLSW